MYQNNLMNFYTEYFLINFTYPKVVKLTLSRIDMLDANPSGG